MRTTSLLTGLVLGAFALCAPHAQAAVTRVVTSGTTANLNLVTSIPGSRPDCTIDVWVVLMGSTTVQRTDNTTSTGAIGFVQRVDNCTDEFEFGSFNVALAASAFTSTAGSATLKATFPVVLDSFGPAGGTVTRTLAANLVYTNVENNSVAARSFSMLRAPGFTLVTRGRSIYNAASFSGQLTLGGTTLLPAQASSVASIESATSATIDITR